MQLPDEPDTSPVTSPVISPTKAVEVTEVNPVIVVSRLRVTVPEVPPPVSPLPAVTPSMSPATVCQEQVPSPSSRRNFVPPLSPVDLTSVPSIST